MDERSKEYLNKILAKTPEELNSQEIGFLRARRSYLKKAQLEEYQSVLETKPAKEQTVKQKHDKTTSK